MLNSDRGQDSFIFQGKKLPYNRLAHNNTPPSERAVEIPIAFNFLTELKDKTRLLEVGNVLSYYDDFLKQDIGIKDRIIIDKYEVNPGVKNIDLMDLPADEKYNTIISVSTVEHIGQGLDPNQSYGDARVKRNDIEAPLKAIVKIYDLLSDRGTAMITVPFGKFIEGGWFIQFSQAYLNLLTEKYAIPKNAITATSFLKLVNVNSGYPLHSTWIQVNAEEVANAQYNSPFKFANAIGIIELCKIPASPSKIYQPTTSYPQPEEFRVTSKLCVYRDFETEYYRYWIAKLKAPTIIHRKYWEWVVMSEALKERGLLKPGKKGMGFAVGNEPLPSAFASFGCEIVATDQSYDVPEAQEDWATSDQLCRGKQALNEKEICPPESFEKLVSFRDVDMNNIPDDLKQNQFDFIWSSCAFEHIGSIEHGIRFVKESMKCLKEGGIAIHTTEFNCLSNAGTINAHNLVFFRRRDIERIISELEVEGYYVEPVDYYLGNDEYDRKAMKEPHNHLAPHLRIELGGYIATSLLLIIHKQQKISVGADVPTFISGNLDNRSIKLVYDISVLGYGYYESRSRTGVARVVENIASELIASKQFDLSFCGGHSLYAANACLDYLETQPSFQGISFAHSSFIKILQSKLMELYKMLEIQEKVSRESIKEAQYQEIAAHLKKSVTNSINIAANYPNLIDADALRAADIFHATFFEIPDQVKNFKNLKVFATVYDLIPIVLSHLFLGKNDSDYHRMLSSLQKLTPDNFILCISQATRNDLLNHVKLDPAKVFVTYLAANPNLFYPCFDAGKIAAVRNKYQIPDAPYILGVSTLEPRKNLEHTIRCFAKLVQEQGIKDLYLVLVGALGWNYEKIFQEISKWGLSKDRIIVTGYVADEDLAALYSGALVFVYPSLYEGFGLPPLEAMQCGIPVITSNTSSLPEVVGDAGIMLHPEDADGLCHSILQLYKTPSLRKEMSSKSLEQAKKFSWARCIEETIAAYKIAVSN